MQVFTSAAKASHSTAGPLKWSHHRCHLRTPTVVIGHTRNRGLPRGSHVGCGKRRSL